MNPPPTSVQRSFIGHLSLSGSQGVLSAQMPNDRFSIGTQRLLGVVHVESGAAQGS
ncbi:MAG: hypothetical protein AAF449_00950 [Myxococcota bacterium]